MEHLGQVKKRGLSTINRMNFESLESFIRDKMSMTHIYQPVMIKEILKSDDQATTKEIAREFIDWDDSLL